MRRFPRFSPLPVGHSSQFHLAIPTFQCYNSHDIKGCDGEQSVRMGQPQRGRGWCKRLADRCGRSLLSCALNGLLPL